MATPTWWRGHDAHPAVGGILGLRVRCGDRRAAGGGLELDLEEKVSDYYGDVTYEVWRSGRNPDDVDRDRVRDYEYDGYSAQEAATAIIRHKEQLALRRREAAELEESYWAHQQEQEYPELDYPIEPEPEP
jgi:hypothetical protein